jgi:hypothetical protein
VAYAYAYATHSTLKPVCAPDDGWRYRPKHVEQFPYIINCVTFHFVGYILEYKGVQNNDTNVLAEREFCEGQYKTLFQNIELMLD